MKHLFPLVIVVAVCAAGCSSPLLSRSQGPEMTGDQSARFTDVFQEGAFAETRTVDVHHAFMLRNAGDTPATIVSHRTAINTTWRFEDTGDGRLPRTLAPGETTELRMRGRMYKPEPVRFFTELTFESGETMMLEMHVES